MSTDVPGADVLTGPDAETMLRTVLAATGVTLHRARTRAVHRRGSNSVSVVYEGDVTDSSGRERSLLYVGHVSRSEVPQGPAVISHGDAKLYVWRFPDDPYLPGLAPLIRRESARQVLDRIGAPDGPVRIHTRSYRPTRRAVVQLGTTTQPDPLVYAKVLGGRSPRRIRERTRALAAAHAHLGSSLPVPPTLEIDVEGGTVLLDAMPGVTMRSLLRSGEPVPEVAAIVELIEQLIALPPFDEQADPGRYADISRHARALSRLLPDTADDIADIAREVGRIGGPTGMVHGDLHDGQILVQDRRIVGLLDVDGAGTGLIAYDVGRLVANIEVAASHDPPRSGGAREVAMALFDAVGHLAPPADIARGAAAAWIGLATGPYRVQAASWEADTRARIQSAARWLDRT